ncbi:MAG: VWA domain-containing protein [Acidobacteriota bacterium]
MVKVYVTVRGEDGKPFAGLGRADFTVLEDGKKQEISYFSQEKIPLKVGLVLDCSLSMERNMEAAKSAAIQFIEKLAPEDEALVIGFGDTVRSASVLTRDRKELESQVKKMYAAGGTALYDALHTAILTLRGEEGKAAIVLLSDGKDEAWAGGRPGSRKTFEEIKEELARSEIALYPIAFGTVIDFSMEWDIQRNYPLRDILETLARVSGGSCLFTQSATGLPSSFLSVLDELRRQYNLFYTPSNTNMDGKWREITVVLNRPSRKLNYKQGYYATH